MTHKSTCHPPKTMSKQVQDPIQKLYGYDYERVEIDHNMYKDEAGKWKFTGKVKLHVEMKVNDASEHLLKRMMDSHTTFEVGRYKVSDTEKRYYFKTVIEYGEVRKNCPCPICFRRFGNSND